jgi:hypothetical protein
MYMLREAIIDLNEGKRTLQSFNTFANIHNDKSSGQ